MLTRRSLRWRHNGRVGVSNHQPNDCVLKRLFRRRSKKTSKLRVTGLCARNSPGTGEFPHKWPVTRKMFPFDDVIMFFRKWNVISGVRCNECRPRAADLSEDYMFRLSFSPQVLPFFVADVFQIPVVPGLFMSSLFAASLRCVWVLHYISLLKYGRIDLERKRE